MTNAKQKTSVVLCTVDISVLAHTRVKRELNNKHYEWFICSTACLLTLSFLLCGPHLPFPSSQDSSCAGQGVVKAALPWYSFYQMISLDRSARLEGKRFIHQTVSCKGRIYCRGGWRPPPAPKTVLWVSMKKAVHPHKMGLLEKRKKNSHNEMFSLKTLRHLREVFTPRCNTMHVPVLPPPRLSKQWLKGTPRPEKMVGGGQWRCSKA